MRSTYSISFACRKAKADRQGKAHVSTIIIIRGERCTFNLPLKENPETFLKLISSRKHNPVRDYCMGVEDRLNSLRIAMENQGQTVSPQSLKDAYFNGITPKSKTLGYLRDSYMKIIGDRGIAVSAIKKYRFAIESLVSELGEEKPLSDIHTSDIRVWLEKLKNRYQASTVYGYLNKGRAFFSYAAESEWIPRNPFDGVRTNKGQKTVRVLSYDDYRKIADRTFSISRVEKIRKMYVFACGSGLAWIDCHRLRPSDFKSIDGQLCVLKNRVKTDVPFYSIILPDAAKIAKELNFDFSALQISNQKTNQALKDIQDSLEINSVDKLTFHSARHFYINRLIAEGVSTATVTRCAGHTNFRQSFSYSNLTIEDMIKEVGKHIDLNPR